MAATIGHESGERDVSLLLKYNGPAVDDGTMDVYDAAANMVAFSNFIVAAAKEVYGPDTKITAEVTAFKHSSFATEIFFQVVGGATILMQMMPDLRLFLGAVKDSLEIRNLLKGQPPAKVEPTDVGLVRITNRDGNVFNVSTHSLNLTLNVDAQGALGQFVASALEKPGVDSVSMGTKTQTIAAVQQTESRYFRPIAAVGQVTEGINDMGLVIEAPSFRDGNKWRVTDGQSSFPVSIEDEVFLARVDAGEAFRKGDVLHCRVRIRQERDANGFKVERAVLEVLKHETRAEQVGMFPVDDE